MPLRADGRVFYAHKEKYMDIIDKANVELEHVEYLLATTTERYEEPTPRQLEIEAFSTALDSIAFLRSTASLSDEQYKTVESVLLCAARSAANEAPLVRPPSIGDITHRTGTALTSFLFTTDGGPNRYNDQMGAEHEDKLR